MKVQYHTPRIIRPLKLFSPSLWNFLLSVPEVVNDFSYLVSGQFEEWIIHDLIVSVSISKGFITICCLVYPWYENIALSFISKHRHLQCVFFFLAWIANKILPVWWEPNITLSLSVLLYFCTSWYLMARFQIPFTHGNLGKRIHIHKCSSSALPLFQARSKLL